MGPNCPYSTAISGSHTGRARILPAPCKLHATVQVVRSVLEAVPYNSSDVFLHTDVALMPRRRATWASWNFIGTCVPAVPEAYFEASRPPESDGALKPLGAKPLPHSAPGLSLARRGLRRMHCAGQPCFHS